MSIPSLPVELWLLIFRFATSAPISLSTHYEPFQSCSTTAEALSDAALHDKCTLTLVCRQWRLLVRDMLYEDIRIGRGISALHAALSDDSDTEPPPIADADGGAPAPRVPRHRVRRAVLPYAHTATPTKDAPPSLALLALLPYLEVLVRPPPHRRHRHRHLTTISTHVHASTTPAASPSPSPSPHPRFEFPTPRPLCPRYAASNGPRAGGINALDDVLRAAAPSLRELVLAGPMPLSVLRQQHPRLHLRALRTLRFRAGAAACPFVARQATYWALPALENVVVEGEVCAEALEALWEAFGALVRVLEVQDVGRMVSACPALEELNVRVGAGAEDLNSSAGGSGSGSGSDGIDVDGGGVSRTSWACAHDTLLRVGICVDFGAAEAGEWTVETWTAVVDHVVQFGKGCPALRCVVLYVRDVRVAARNPQFHVLRETLLSNERQLLLRSVHA
ncbi:hypothetical protein BJV74DRAFT_881650 [Russula compacta]|nr:hypothetical protein BJV74DRAFT_881650 [Russula compacta]